MLLYQPENGYSFNSDSIFLYGFISTLKLNGKVLDVGAGCGILGLLCARDFSHINLYAVEKQPLYVEYAQKNAVANNIEYTIINSDFFDLDGHGSYDWIISNPPFYREGSARSNDPMIHQARYNVHMPIDKFAKKIAKLLRSRGEIAICYDASQTGVLLHKLESNGIRAIKLQFVHSKPNKEAHLVLIHAKKGSLSQTKIEPPMIVYDESGKYTKMVDDIYKKSKAHSIKCQI